MSLRMEFVERATASGAKLAPLCREFGISRQTAYKWLKRFKEQGFEGLEEQSRRPSSSPLSFAEEVVHAALEALPSLLPAARRSESQTPAATGTEGPPAGSVCTPVCTGFAQTNDTGRDCLRPNGSSIEQGSEIPSSLNPLISQGVEAGCDSVRLVDTRVGDGTRTRDFQIHSLTTAGLAATQAL